VPARSRVLVVEGERRFRRNLVAALEEDFDVELRGAEGVPSTVGDARDFDLILVSDVPRYRAYGGENLGASHVRALETYVREGGALVMTGGENSFGPGGYGGTPLERRLLPVHLDVETQEDVPSLALMLVIDRSGSMSGPKITLAKEAARATMDVLQPSDMLGVMAFDSAPHTVVRLQRAANRLRITDSLSKLRPGGGTSIFPALDKAYEALEGVEAKVKHIILLTDGVSSHRGQVLDLVNQRARSKTTVSSVAVGLGSDQGLLMQIAEVGGGRYYFTDRPDNIPKLFLKEASEVTRRSLVEDRFRARVVRRHRHLQIFKGLDMGRAPPLLGYVSTRPKRAAEVLMVTHTGEPLLARWRLGLGQVAVWTSDVKNKWGHYWLKWSGFAQLWRQLIRETRRVEKQDPTLDLSLDIAEGTLSVAVDAIDEADRFMDDLESEVVVEGPTGKEETVALRQTAPGRYEGSLPVTAYGPYTARGGHHTPGEEEATAYRSFATAVWPYPSELLVGEPDLEPLKTLSAATGGVCDPSLPQLFDTGGQRLPRPSPHWPLGVFIALAAVLADVLLRRIRLPSPWRPAQG
ncbi:MAG: VWA domain-containing protein, partial [Myxococcota bacterium]|nr:VWA domain-containing protein [Myxococcota bacterium]